MKPNLPKLVLDGVALAMGVAVIVTNIVNPIPPNAATMMLAIGLAALAFEHLQKSG